MSLEVRAFCAALAAGLGGIGLVWGGAALMRVAQARPVPAPAPQNGRAREEVRHGQALFGEHCASCHGVDAAGTGRGPGLRDARPTRKRLIAVIGEGVEGAMPGFGDVLTAHEIRALAFFIEELPGTPSKQPPVSLQTGPVRADNKAGTSP